MARQILALALSVLLAVLPVVQAEPPATPWRVLATELPPLALEKGSDAPGALIELVREMAHRSGQDIRVEYLPWTRAQAMTQSGTHTLILPLTRTPERETRYRWLVPLYTRHIVFFVLGSRGADSLSVESLRKRRIGVLRSTPGLGQLRERGFTQILEIESNDKMARMLKLGMLDALYGDERINRYSLQKNGLGAAGLKVFPPQQTDVLWLGGSKDISDAEIALWQDALAQIRRDKTLDRILGKYHLKD
ncbi:substrate-binding periplasmic protein [Niveibacterium terrae]|uniref:substrate-binding periplasmic protein n=1 Tax=Niveibacterium terrae TaxID=3373598 RepID=UPI003A923E29